MESDDEHTHKNIDNDVCNIDQSTLDIGHHFKLPLQSYLFEFVELLVSVFLLPFKVGDIEGEKKRIIRLLGRQGTLTMEERDQPNLRRLSLATA